MFRILRLAKPYMFFILLAPLFMLLEVAMDLMQPTLMQQIIDRGVAESNQALIYATGWKMILCAFLGMLGGCGCTFFSSRAATAFGRDLRCRLFHKIQSFSFEETDRFTTGSLITRLTNDTDVMQHVIVKITRMFIRSPLLLAGSVVLVFRTNPRLSVPLLLAAPILAGIVVFYIRKVRPQFEVMQRRLDDVNAVMQENLTGIRVVKAFAAEDKERARFDEANERLTTTGITTQKIMVTLGPALSLVQQTTVIIIVFIAAKNVDRGLMEIGQVAAIFNYATQVLMSLIMISFEILMFSRAQVSAQRINDVLDTEPAIRSGSVAASPASGAVEFRDVSFSYPGAAGDPVLQDITLRIAPGEHIAILGATGSGKTSLVNLVARFYDAARGSVSVGGRDVKDYDLHALRGALGIVMQEARLFAGTVAENIRWGNPDAADAQVQHAAKVAQAHDFIMSFPDGYGANIAQAGVTLSGGQKQRLSIARALLRRPKILILDDSTSAIDTLTEQRLQHALRNEMSGMTVIIIAQRISSTTNANRIAVLDNGRLVALGTRDELLRDSATFREIVDSQNTGAQQT